MLESGDDPFFYEQKKKLIDRTGLRSARVQDGRDSNFAKGDEPNADSEDLVKHHASEKKKGFHSEQKEFVDKSEMSHGSVKKHVDKFISEEAK